MEPRDFPRTLRRLDGVGWLSTARAFRRSLAQAGHEPGRLLVVGTPEDEPWHLAAHLDQAAGLRDAEALRPVLVRWRVPPGAPPHLSVGVSALTESARRTTVLVAAPAAVDDRLLERLDDARTGGATLFALHDASDALAGLAHESLSVPRADVPLSDGWEVAQHVVAAPTLPDARRLAQRLRHPRR